MENNGIKDTHGKPRMSLVPYDAMEAIAIIREYGINKYKNTGAWYHNGNSIQFIDAAIRHLGKHCDCHLLNNRYEIDEESGLDHLDHALCSLAMAVSLRRKEQKDETKEEVLSWE